MTETIPRERIAAKAGIRTTPILEVRSLSKRFPIQRGWRALFSRGGASTTVVLENVSFSMGAGEFFGLLGPNGAGKTTLFKILATLIRPDGGSATVAGQEIIENPGRVREALSLVSADERSLHWRISARENLRLYAALQGVSRREVVDRTESLLRAVGLADTHDVPVGKFSSGMKQRLLIARALVGRPRILLLDEPTRSLDPVSARDFRRFLKDEVVGRQGCTVLLATHNAEEALELCPRIGVLDRGRLLAVGTPAELWAQAGDDRYRLWTTTPDHPTLRRLEGAGSIRSVRFDPPDVSEDGWVAVTLEIPGGPQSAAEVLATAIRGGASISRFERNPISLADLIAGVVARHARGREHA